MGTTLPHPPENEAGPVCPTIREVVPHGCWACHEDEQEGTDSSTIAGSIGGSPVIPHHQGFPSSAVQPDQRGQGQVVDKGDIGVQGILDVPPVKLDATCTNLSMCWEFHD